MSESGMDPRDLLEGLLELASAAELEVRILSKQAASADNGLQESAACRVGSRIWVVLSPDDPSAYQAEVLGEALSRYRSEFLEGRFMAPALRELIDRVDPLRR
jgi:hypothetical protein